VSRRWPGVIARQANVLEGAGQLRVPEAVGGAGGASLVRFVAPVPAFGVVPHDLLPDTPAPQKVVQWAQDEVGAPQAPAGRAQDSAAFATNLAYSAASGEVYGLTRPGPDPGSWTR
jgi:hypothetical protein